MGASLKNVSGEKGFLGLTSVQQIKTLKNQVFILPFGFEIDEGSGCCAAPQAIISASKEINLFDERFGCYPYQQMEITTIKDISPSKSTRQALQKMQQWQETLYQNKQLALILGGENRLIPQAIAPWLMDKNLAFIHLGAHAGILHDLVKQYPELVVLGFGLRSINEAQYQLAQAEPQRLSLYYARDNLSWDWLAIRERLANKTIYLSLSADCFDMSLLPASPCPEPGGLLWNEVINCLENLVQIAPIAGACFCDFSPLDNLPLYDLLAAKLIYRLLATFFCMKPNHQSN